MQVAQEASKLEESNLYSAHQAPAIEALSTRREHLLQLVQRLPGLVEVPYWGDSEEKALYK